jgi:hypothetical protein
MPDCDNWTAAMVLKWALTRDPAVVLDMVDIYGARGVFEDGTVSRLPPEDMDAVMIGYSIDPMLPHGEERTVTAIVRSQRVIAVKNEIYRALRRGELGARARRNGIGDMEKIAPEEWLSMKFQSWNGHDLAVPVDVEQNPLHPRPVPDYLDGRVPICMRPPVWPDPLFSADQVTQIWPSDGPKQAIPSIEGPPQRADKPVLGRVTEPGKRPDGVSDNDWQTFVSAHKKGYDLRKRGSITGAARSIARERGHESEFQSERRALHRVLEAARKKN